MDGCGISTKTYYAQIHFDDNRKGGSYIFRPHDQEPSKGTFTIEGTRITIQTLKTDMSRKQEITKVIFDLIVDGMKPAIA
jgi:hypothetical protein